MRNSLRDLRAQPIRNWCAEPRPQTVGGPASDAFYRNSGSGASVTLVDGSCRITNTGEGVAVALRAGFGQRMPAKPGDQVTMLVRARANSARTHQLQIRRDSTSTAVVAQHINLTPTWTWFRISGVLPETVVDSVHMGILFSLGSWTQDAWVDVSHVMWVRDAYTGEYSDGNTPGWKWTGTAGRSESVGWPYTLESIAGKPAAIQEAAGTSSHIRPSSEPVTLFAAYEVLETVSSGSFILLGRVGANVVLERRGAAPYTEGWVRVSNLQGSNLQRQTPGGATLGSHVIGLSYGDPNLITGVQDGSLYTMTYGTAYTQLATSSSYIERPASDSVTRRIAVYTWRRALSNAEMVAVSQWLANKYN